MSDLSRRDAIKVLGATAGAVGIAALPESWEKASVEASTLPRVSAASGEPTPTTTPSPVPTATVMPTVTITSPTMYQYVGTYTPTIVGTSTDATSVTVSIDGDDVWVAATLAGDGSWTYAASFLVENPTTHTVEARATNSRGSTTSLPVSFFTPWVYT